MNRSERKPTHQDPLLGDQRGPPAVPLTQLHEGRRTLAQLSRWEWEEWVHENMMENSGAQPNGDGEFHLETCNHACIFTWHFYHLGLGLRGHCHPPIAEVLDDGPLLKVPPSPQPVHREVGWQGVCSEDLCTTSEPLGSSGRGAGTTPPYHQFQLLQRGTLKCFPSHLPPCTHPCNLGS